MKMCNPQDTFCFSLYISCMFLRSSCIRLSDMLRLVSFLFLQEDKENLMHHMWNIVCKFTKIITIDDNLHAD
jgi:hypothetical protein